MTWPEAEVAIDADLVHRLVTDQFPSLAGREVREVRSGFDNSLWRLGDHEVVRLPRRQVGATLLANELRWLDTAAGHVSLATPLPLRGGAPGHGYPWVWSIGAWIDGAPGDEVDVAVRSDSAARLASFLRELHRPAPPDAPRNPVRGGPLAGRDAAFTENLTRVADAVDTSALRGLWQRAIAAGPYQGPPLWLHGDPHPANTVYDHGRLVGVIDFGDLCAGDPACDLASGFLSLSGGALATFLAAYGGVDLGTAWRSLGWAVHFGVIMTSLALGGSPSYGPIGALALSNAASFAAEHLDGAPSS